MKVLIAAAVVLIAAWVGLWVSDTGVLIYSGDTGVIKTRDCRYFIGVTVVRRILPLADRCPITRKVGP